jgi:hypothetical protein
MRRTLLVAALLAAGTACAQQCDGTWDGRLGAAPLMLQFNWDRLGWYYLGTALSGAVLRPIESTPPSWDEYDEQGHRTATLRLSCQGEALSGERTSVDGQRSAVSARRVEDATYNRRRLAAAELVTQRALPEHGRVLEVATVRGLPQLETVRIRQPRGAEVAVNARLRAALLQQLDNHLQCQALLRAQGQFEHPGGDSFTLQRLAWNGSVLSLQFWLHGLCGGTDAYASPQQYTFDTTTGQELPLARWLQADYAEGVAAGTPLHDQLVLPQILRGRRKLEDLPASRRGCAAYELAEKAVPRGVEEDGMVFGFDYSEAMASCGLAFVLPWARLEPFLSDDGRRWRQAMQATPRR